MIGKCPVLRLSLRHWPVTEPMSMHKSVMVWLLPMLSDKLLPAEFECRLLSGTGSVNADVSSHTVVQPTVASCSCGVLCAMAAELSYPHVSLPRAGPVAAACNICGAELVDAGHFPVGAMPACSCSAQDPGCRATVALSSLGCHTLQCCQG